ncbi:hypothetical protein CR513_11660, partial [Mucuna pruriens]
MGNARFIEEVKFGKEENIRNVVFDQVLVPITFQETTLIIGDNVQTIVLEQDYDEILPQTLIEQPQQP